MTTTIVCDRCGSISVVYRLILRMPASLAKRYDEPRIALCASCAQQFKTWLQSEQETFQTDRAGAPKPSVTESSGVAGHERSGQFA